MMSRTVTVPEQTITDPALAKADPVLPIRDLDTRAEIHDLVVTFYREIVFDDLLGPVFDEVAEVDWAAHIPKLIDYWCRVLLGQPGYDGYILGAHHDVHERQAFAGELFDRWYTLFVLAVDGGWQGPVAEKAKAHAARMASVLAHRLVGLEWKRPEGLDRGTSDELTASRG
jgi:hemoglobin